MPSYVILSWVDVRHGWQRILNCFVNKPASCLFHSTSERAPQAWKFCQRFFVTSWFFFEIFLIFFRIVGFFFLGGGNFGISIQDFEILPDFGIFFKKYFLGLFLGFFLKEFASHIFTYNEMFFLNIKMFPTFSFPKNYFAIKRWITSHCICIFPFPWVIKLFLSI